MKFKLLSLIFFSVFSIGTLLAQYPGPISAAETPIDKAAPIGGGLIILASLGIGYGLARIYRMRRNFQDLKD
jgi:hypothetical protein